MYEPAYDIWWMGVSLPSLAQRGHWYDVHFSFQRARFADLLSAVPPAWRYSLYLRFLSFWQTVHSFNGRFEYFVPARFAGLFLMPPFRDRLLQGQSWC